jgi:hypothetical protein
MPQQGYCRLNTAAAFSHVRVYPRARWLPRCCARTRVCSGQRPRATSAPQPEAAQGRNGAVGMRPHKSSISSWKLRSLVCAGVSSVTMWFVIS